MNKIYETKDLSVGYGAKVVLSGVEITVNEGEILTLVGPNGAGKSTLLKTLISELEILGGVITLNGKEMKSISSSELAKELSIVMTGKPKTEYMTVRDVVAMGRYPYTGRMGVLTEEDKKIVEEIIKEAALADIAECYFDELSDGQRQRVMLARALCQQPKVLILDEPTSFLDIRYKIEILSQIKERVKNHGLAVILSLHELDLAAQISDKVLCIKGNKVDRYGSVKEILTDEYINELFEVDLEKKHLLSSMVEPQKTKDKARSERKKKARVIMVQGTMSNAGKSLLVGGLCRVFYQDGYKVCPFKSQNMALNSFITEDGLEMGRAQVMQAEASGIKPRADMNPILLKPTTDVGSQVIVNGKSIGNMSAVDYFAYKKNLIPDIKQAYERLEDEFDIIVIEGAGSPAEINLKENDIVNMGLAEALDAPVLLVGDIDRGGVFAQLLGTMELLEPSERNRVEGLVINKFRGDKSILDPGIISLEKLSGKPVLGTVPYMTLSIDDEDSLSSRLDAKAEGLIDVAVIRLPKISNFTDLHALELQPGVGVRYVSSVGELKNPDMIVLPGTKNTIADLKWLRESGLEAMIKKKEASGVPVFGICGGYQILCEQISDPLGVEGGGEIEGLGLLPGKTILEEEKTTTQTVVTLGQVEGIFACLSGLEVTGYEIHMGRTEGDTAEGSRLHNRGNVYGTYLHGFFDEGEIAYRIVDALAKEKGVDLSGEAVDFEAMKNREYDKLADGIRASFDMKKIYEIMEKYYDAE